MSSRSTAWGTEEKRKVPYREASVACPLEWASEDREEDSMDIHGSAPTGTQGAKHRVQKWHTCMTGRSFIPETYINWD